MKVRVLLMLVALAVTGSNAQLDVCGIAPRNTRIVGGGDAPVGAWPWQVSVNYKGRLACGGTLINNQWVLTAAQCIVSDISNYTIHLGREYQLQPNPNEVSLQVSKTIVHPFYDSKTFNNDIALMQLSSPVVFSDYIRPVCLAAVGSEYNAGTTCWITGWGDIKADTPLPFPGKLQEVEVSVVSHSECNSVYGLITCNMICVGSTKGGEGICQGDAGAPLMRKYDHKWVQAGVAIFGSIKGCGLPNIPEGFARVSEYQSWIESQITTDHPGFIWAGAVGLTSLSLPLMLSILLGVFSLFVLS
uniref:prostasin-like n=1 Tax=Scatophagus argus TaxID=75038 RepID=UPI001ED814BD|nr:prostasin-like [Scatophagus argus]